MHPGARLVDWSVLWRVQSLDKGTIYWASPHSITTAATIGCKAMCDLHEDFSGERQCVAWNVLDLSYDIFPRIMGEMHGSPAEHCWGSSYFPQKVKLSRLSGLPLAVVAKTRARRKSAIMEPFCKAHARTRQPGNPATPHASYHRRLLAVHCSSDCLLPSTSAILGCDTARRFLSSGEQTRGRGLPCL